MSNYRRRDIQHWAGLFKALSNPHRLSIFLRLAECCGDGPRCRTDRQMGACVGELGKELGVVPSTVSHHIKELRQAGLIRMQRRGQNIQCWVEPGTLDALAAFLAQSVST